MPARRPGVSASLICHWPPSRHPPPAYRSCTRPRCPSPATGAAVEEPTRSVAFVQRQNFRPGYRCLYAHGADRTQIALTGIPIARSQCHDKTGTRRVPDTRVRDVGLSRDERGCGRHVASHPGCDPRGQGLGVSRVEAARARTRRVKESSSRLGRNFRGLRQVPERGI